MFAESFYMLICLCYGNAERSSVLCLVLDMNFVTLKTLFLCIPTIIKYRSLMPC
jgi:hypothetical protein